jgi:hypothetical protein
MMMSSGGSWPRKLRRSRNSPEPTKWENNPNAATDRALIGVWRSSCSSWDFRSLPFSILPGRSWQILFQSFKSLLQELLFCHPEPFAPSFWRSDSDWRISLRINSAKGLVTKWKTRFFAALRMTGWRTHN